VESGLSRSYPGLGLGLAVARKLATLMNGRLEVHSNVGVGSTFTVRIPVRQPSETASETVALPDWGESSPAILAVKIIPSI